MEHAGPNPTGIRPECRGSVTSSAHWRGASGAHLNAPGCVTLDELRGGKIDTWHVYELIWSPTRLVWKVDGVVTRRSTPETDNWWAPGAQSSAAPFDQPFFLTLNLQVAGWANHPNPALQSGSMWIDWVRVWQRR
jgi:beta-glucanase (GH16 family)